MKTGASQLEPRWNGKTMAGGITKVSNHSLLRTLKIPNVKMTGTMAMVNGVMPNANLNTEETQLWISHTFLTLSPREVTTSS